MPDLAKSDILNYEAPLGAMTSRSIYYPHRPPWERDGEMLVSDLWDKPLETDAERARLLVEEVFFHPTALAVWLGIPVRRVQHLLATPSLDTFDGWGCEYGGPHDRLWHAYVTYRVCERLAQLDKSAYRLLCRPEEIDDLRTCLVHLQRDPSRYLGGSPHTITMLGSMLALGVNNYSCWTDQWRWPAK